MYQSDYSLVRELITQHEKNKRVEYLQKLLNYSEAFTMANVRTTNKNGDRLYGRWASKIQREIKKIVKPEEKPRTIWDNIERKSKMIN